jgi:RNA polymerase sigma factor for flagellar operon FliA
MKILTKKKEQAILRSASISSLYREMEKRGYAYDEKKRKWVDLNQFSTVELKEELENRAYKDKQRKACLGKEDKYNTEKEIISAPSIDTLEALQTESPLEKRVNGTNRKSREPPLKDLPDSPIYQQTEKLEPSLPRAIVHPARPRETYTHLRDRDMNSIWTEYQSTQSEDIRNFLMEKFLPLVTYQANKIKKRVPEDVDVEDLQSAGIFGLMDAIKGFDLSRKVKFETYCASRIRGAILDELRAIDWVPRLVRHRTAKRDKVLEDKLKADGTAPREEEIAERLGVSLEEYDRKGFSGDSLRNDSRAKNITSLNRQIGRVQDGNPLTLLDVQSIKDKRGQYHNPLTDVQRKDVKGLLLKGFSRAERLIVELYYYEGMTMREIGSTIDLSESTVSQMHTSILLRLKAQMKEKDLEDINE